jgi:hypothetical protein
MLQAPVVVLAVVYLLPISTRAPFVATPVITADLPTWSVEATRAVSGVVTGLVTVYEVFQFVFVQPQPLPQEWT